MSEIEHGGVWADVAWDSDMGLWNGTIRGTDITFQAAHWPDIITIFKLAVEQYGLA